MSRVSPPLPRRPTLATVIAGASDEEARRAAVRSHAAVQGKELAGRTLTVDEARPREPRREPRQARW